MEMKQEPLPSMENPCWLVGRNSRGHWTARDRSGRQGGLFASLAAAQRYARLETIGREATIVIVTDHLELELSAAHHSCPRVGNQGPGRASVDRLECGQCVRPRADDL
jgi:hypothetical protein